MTDDDALQPCVAPGCQHPAVHETPRIHGTLDDWVRVCVNHAADVGQRGGVVRLAPKGAGER